MKVNINIWQDLFLCLSILHPDGAYNRQDSPGEEENIIYKLYTTATFISIFLFICVLIVVSWRRQLRDKSA